jgi:hypothetical protein
MGSTKRIKVTLRFLAFVFSVLSYSLEAERHLNRQFVDHGPPPSEVFIAFRFHDDIMQIQNNSLVFLTKTGLFYYN